MHGHGGAALSTQKAACGNTRAGIEKARSTRSIAVSTRTKKRIGSNTRRRNPNGRITTKRRNIGLRRKQASS